MDFEFKEIEPHPICGLCKREIKSKEIKYIDGVPYGVRCYEYKLGLKNRKARRKEVSKDVQTYRVF